MRKLRLFLVAIMLFLGILAGCSGEEGANDASGTDQNDATTEQTEQDVEAEAFPVTLEDGTGEEITIEEEPERIVSLMPSNTEIAFALGLEEKIVGVSDHDNYPEEALDKEKIGGMELNIEKIISLEPDLVLAHPTNDPDGIEQLEDADIPVFNINDATNFDEVYESIDMLGEVTGTIEQSEEIVAEMKEDLADLEKKADDIPEDDVKTVYVEISPEPEIFTPGKNTFEDEILSIINAENAAGDEDGWVELSEEAVVEMNPDVIVLTYDDVDDPVEAVLERDAWQDIDAIKNEQVVQVDTDLVSRPGPRLVEGAEALAEVIYPEVFGES
ncbi:MAG TPA: ABC transporter substrate-binding protein [Bacillota bacterium]|nr:ABC transporter substrate-binding protein [Bacillota bacterium]